jgi:lipopolysaccharide cholinephosphotransferase
MNKKQAKQYLLEISNIYDKYNLKYFLLHGTLLGAIRDGNIIDNDTDIDLGHLKNWWSNGILVAKVTKDLYNKGFKIKRIWNGGERIAICKNNIRISNEYYKRKGKVFFNYGDNGYREFSETFFKKLDRIDFLGRIFNAPHNPKKFLKLLYGKDWKIPISKDKTKYYNRKSIKWNKSIEIKTIIKW